MTATDPRPAGSSDTDVAGPAELPSLGVVVPLFNEAAGLADFHRALVAVLESVADRYRWCVLYVVDPSPDGTATRARALADSDDRVGALILMRRAGHQMSLVAGMERIGTDVVVTMDGDLQHPPELLPRILDLYETGVDVVQTVRTSTAGQSLLSAAASRSFYRLMTRLSEVPMVPGGADYRLMSGRVVRILTKDIQESDRFLRGLLPWLGMPTATVEFEAPARGAGESKYTFRRSLQLATSGIVSFSKVPLQLGIVLGLVVGALGLLSGVAAFIARLSGADIPAGWATLVVMVAVLSGMQLVALGLIGTYLGVVFDEAKKRPQIIVGDHVEATPSPVCAEGGPDPDRGLRGDLHRTSTEPEQ